ncbi:glycoside hydrolase family 71 protein [Cyathus striatus]|nr:glycoside hydrolase family 71 protein [Cyathus striatus]
MARISSRFKPLLFFSVFATLKGVLVDAAPTIPFPLQPRLVVAHFMVGNTFPYTYDDWAEDIILAASKGIDGFALNVGADSWEPARVKDAFYIASHTSTTSKTTDYVPPWTFPYGTNHTDFHLFLSFDMTSFPCGSLSDAEQLRNFIRSYRRHPRYLRYEGKMLVSTFSGESCTFGQGNTTEGWSRALDFELRDDVHFVLLFLSLTGVRWRGGWEGAWPKGNYSIEPYPDYEHLRYNYGKTYMAGVSPWFFTHYGPNSYNKNWVFRSDDWLAVQRWELIVQNRAYIDIAQIISWNDYGESHYVGPVHGAQPGSQSWVDGFDHTAWLDMMQYYIDAYKTGKYPDITKDQIFLWGRLFPRDAVATGDPVEKPTHADWTEDYIWGLVLLTEPSHISISCGPSNLSADLPAGANKIKLDLTPEHLASLGETFTSCQVTMLIQRDGRDVGSYVPLGFTWRNVSRVERYNFNAFVVATP